VEQLSNYELLDLLTTYGSDSGGHFMNFLAVFSAYLIAGYVLAGKLGRTTLLLLSALYLAVTVMTATGQYLVQMAAVDLANEIVRRGVDLGPNLIGPVTVFSGNSGKSAALVSPIIQALACVGSIIFAFHQAHKTNHGNGT
jgi:hypothetical protein